MEKPIARSVIHRVCNSVLPARALDEESSHMATKVFRERLRKQLIGKQLVDTEENIQELIAFVNRRQVLASVKDYTYVGLQSGEAISRTLAQSSQDAFKTVGPQKKVISTIVSTMDDITSTVKDRKDQKVTIHFYQEYSKFGNFTLEEVVGMRSIFVQTELRTLLSKQPVVGILKPFEGDGVSDTLKELRQTVAAKYSIKYLEFGNWNITATKTRRQNNFAASIFTMRFYFNHEAMYAANISMLDVIDVFLHIMENKSNMSLAASSMKEGIVDVCVNVGEPESSTIVDEENVFLDMHVKEKILTTILGGIPKVNVMTVHQVNLLSMFTPKKPNKYTVADLGMNYWMQENNIEGEVNSKIFRLQVNKKYVHVANDLYYILSDSIPTGAMLPTEEDIDNAFIKYYLSKLGHKDGSFDKLWLIELNVFEMKKYCIDYENQIKPIFDYCGLTSIRLENHELMELPYYVYVYSEEANPEDMILLHFTDKTLEDLSSNAQETLLAYSNVMDKSSEYQENPSQFYVDNAVDINKRLTKYVYAVVDVDRKKITKQEKMWRYFNKLPYEQHVLPHAYSNIVRIPFVNRYKTYCNDWYTTTYTLGADCARNNYTEEFYRVTDASSNADARHIEVFCDVVFEKGFPAGAGHYTGYVHEMGVISQLAGSQQKKQLAAAFNRPFESVKNVDVAGIVGSVAITQDSRSREVEANRRREQEARMRASINSRRGIKPAESEQTLDLSVKAMYIANDPFNVSVDVVAPTTFAITVEPDDFSVISDDYIIQGMDALVSVIRANSESWRARLQGYRSYSKPVQVKIPLTEKSGVIDINPLFQFLFKMATSPFI